MRKLEGFKNDDAVVLAALQFDSINVSLCIL